MKKILIALDNNSSAEKVVLSGYTLARSIQAEVIILHVISEPAYYIQEYFPLIGSHVSHATGSSSVAREIKKGTENFLSAFVVQLGDDSIKTIVLEGEISASILNYSKECKADLIVMGCHSNKGAGRLRISDVAEDVLKHSKIPMLTIPA